MKSQPIPLKEKIFIFLLMFVSSCEIMYCIASQYLYGKSNTTLLIIMICFLAVSIASFQRKKIIDKLQK